MATATFWIDNDNDYFPLILVWGVPAPFVATYEMDDDGFIIMTCASLEIGTGKSIDLDTKNDQIQNWFKEGCRQHFEATMLPECNKIKEYSL